MYAILAAFRKNKQFDYINPLDPIFTEAQIYGMDSLKYFFESVFFIDMTTQFFLEYKHDQDKDMLPIRDIKKISLRYINNKFLFDLLPLIPLELM